MAQPGRIISIEHEEIWRSNIRFFLRELDVDLHFFDNPSSFWKSKTPIFPSDIVLSDYKFSGGEINGVQFLRELRALHPGIYLALFTSFDKEVKLKLEAADHINLFGKSRKLKDFVRSIGA